VVATLLSLVINCVSDSFVKLIGGSLDYMRENIDKIRVFVVNLREIASLIIFYTQKSLLIKTNHNSYSNLFYSKFCTIFSAKNESPTI
tara:strand:+ start:315 stop:578 length:264 start_codon:yes stop_codon:yes gene_type:complete